MGLFASMALMASVWCWGRPEHTSHTNTETQKVHAAPWNKKPARHHTLTHPLFSGKNFECERSVAGCTLNLATKLKIKKKRAKNRSVPIHEQTARQAKNKREDATQTHTDRKHALFRHHCHLARPNPIQIRHPAQIITFTPNTHTNRTAVSSLPQ